MQYLKKTIWSICLLMFVLLPAAGCGGSNEPVQAVDPNAIYTEAAQTVSAQLTAAVTQAPPATETPAAPVEPPTETPMAVRSSPTMPVLATAAINPPPAGDTAVTDPNAAAIPAVPTTAVMAVPTTIPTQPPKDKLEDTAAFVGQFPGDGYEFAPGGSFDAKFTFQNTGDTRWNELYSLRWYQGEKFNKGTKFTFGQYADNITVDKGEVVTLTINGMQAPFGPGVHEGYYCLYNNREDEGKDPQCFYLVYVSIVVK